MMAMVACSDSDTVPTGTPPDPPSPPGPDPTPQLYRIGDHYRAGTAEGIVYKVDETGLHGMIVSLDETVQIWSTEVVDLSWEFGNFSMTDGQANAECIKTIDDWGRKYPAIKWCDAKNMLNLTAWYLPALTETYDLFVAFNGGPPEESPEPDSTRGEAARNWFNECLTGAGGTPLSVDDYWTSTQFGAQDTYSFSFYYGDFSPYETDKAKEHRVRAVRKF